MLELERVEIEWDVSDINCDECGNGMIPRSGNSKVSVECYCETCYSAANKRAEDGEDEEI